MKRGEEVGVVESHLSAYQSGDPLLHFFPKVHLFKQYLSLKKKKMKKKMKKMKKWKKETKKWKKETKKWKSEKKRKNWQTRISTTNIIFKKMLRPWEGEGASQRITPWAGRDRSGKSNSALSGSKCRDPHFQLKVCYSHGSASDEHSCPGCLTVLTFIYLRTGDKAINMTSWNVNNRLRPHLRAFYLRPIRTKYK